MVKDKMSTFYLKMRKIRELRFKKKNVSLKSNGKELEILLEKESNASALKALYSILDLMF